MGISLLALNTHSVLLSQISNVCTYPKKTGLTPLGMNLKLFKVDVSQKKFRSQSCDLDT